MFVWCVFFFVCLFVFLQLFLLIFAFVEKKMQPCCWGNVATLKLINKERERSEGRRVDQGRLLSSADQGR